MKDIAFFFLPAGIGLSFLLLSGVALFQRMAISIQKRSINFQIHKYQINVCVSSLISFYALLRLAFTIFELNNYDNEKANLEFSSPIHNVMNRTYFKKIRLQRNFWILLLCSIAWIFYIRFTHLLLYYREKIKKSDEEYEQIMELKGIHNKCTTELIHDEVDEIKYSNRLEDEDIVSDSDATTDENANSQEKISELKDEQKKNLNIRQRR
ncbi:hypothetical protein, conserved [Plasmodium gonderi]|uniref:Uncharacterized protein n=1 Tax=Plasmodium gonderi TaxID=77519 RepID=A0A1Y1JKA5_PLAGO|nr:hypothetical protein, conserved [Plasmodium gonderi]GAW82939.1 hypothetical protein, conserved [Plasmodium gonderi]